jgi:transposase
MCDGAGWHNSHGLVVPGNITLLALPPYSPELNPVERIWHYLRSHWLANSVFPAWRPSWMPARRRGTGSPPITP